MHGNEHSPHSKCPLIYLKYNFTSTKFCFSPTDAQVKCLKNNFKIYIKIGIKTAPKCLGAGTPSSGSALLVLAKVTVVKIVNYTKYSSMW
jgi:hypothetical protein